MEKTALQKAEEIVVKTVIECNDLLQDHNADEARKIRMKELVDKFQDGQLKSRIITHNAPWSHLLHK
jgi:hypothetical protein